MSATGQRRQAIDFTTIIYRAPTQLIARNGSALLPTPEAPKARLNAAISKLKSDGTVKSLGQKYFGDVDISAQ